MSQRSSPGQARRPDQVAARYLGIKADGSYPRTASEQTGRTLVIICATIEAWAAVSSRPSKRACSSPTSAGSTRSDAHGEVLGAIRLATSMVEVSRLVDEAAVVEIDADAVAG